MDKAQVENKKLPVPQWYDDLPHTIELPNASRDVLLDLSDRLEEIGKQATLLQELLQSALKAAFRHNEYGIDVRIMAAYDLPDAESDFVLRKPEEIAEYVQQGILPPT